MQPNQAEIWKVQVPWESQFVFASAKFSPLFFAISLKFSLTKSLWVALFFFSFVPKLLFYVECFNLTLSHALSKQFEWFHAKWPLCSQSSLNTFLTTNLPFYFAHVESHAKGQGSETFYILFIVSIPLGINAWEGIASRYNMAVW